MSPAANPAVTAMHYCFLSLGPWQGNASYVRLRELGAQMLRRGIHVSYLVDDLPVNRSPLDIPGGAAIEFVAPCTGFGQFKARRDILRRLKPDVFHILNPSPKSWLTIRGLRDLQIVADFDEWFARKATSTLRRWLTAYVDRAHRRRAALVVVASKYMQTEFERLFSLRPLYLPYAAYLPPRDITPVDPPQPPTAVYMGHLFPGYDHDLLFSAAQLLKQRGLTPNIEFLGAGPELDRWRAFAAAENLTNLHLPGSLTGDDLWSHLRAAHVLLFPIRPTIGNLARCPSKTFAYAQAQRPVITCRVSEVPEVLGEAATYVEPTPEAFADILVQTMAAPRQPDVDYHIERHNWSARTDALFAALFNSDLSLHRRTKGAHATSVSAGGTP